MATPEENTPEHESNVDEAKDGSFIERLKKAPPWVWIGIAIALATLVVGYIAMRNSQSGTPGSPSTQPGSSTGNNPNNANPNKGPWATQGEISSLDNRIQQLQQEIQNWHNGGHSGRKHHALYAGGYN